MLFNSLEFIFLFLPLVWVIDRILLKLNKTELSKLFLVIASFFFYGYYNKFYIVLLGISVFSNYLISLCFNKVQANCVSRKLILIIGLLLNFGLLFYFKYFNFFIDNCNFLLHTDFSIEKIALPLGISFFTFQQVSFVVDVYKKKAIHYDFLDYACFVTFFPQLIAGPIVLHSDFIPQLQRRKKKIDDEQLFKGMALFIIGLSKKVLLADTLALLVNPIFDNWAIRTYYLDCLTGILAGFMYLLELYFDFSGYSDMARGLGRIFGFELPINFDSPLKSESIGKFWTKWHITLNNWLREYVYIPLGGNRKGRKRRIINLMIVFLISGVWHGANWTFVIWGALNGLAVVFEKLFQKPSRFNVIRIVFTDVFVSLTMIFFRAENVSVALQIFKRIFTVKPGIHILRIGNDLEIAEKFLIKKLVQTKFPGYMTEFNLATFIIFLAICLYFIIAPNADKRVNEDNWNSKRIIRLSLLFTWVVVSLSGLSTFLYFNF